MRVFPRSGSIAEGPKILNRRAGSSVLHECYYDPKLKAADKLKIIEEHGSERILEDTMCTNET